MSIRTASEFDGICRVGRVVALALKSMAKRLRPGVTTAELDAEGKAVLDAHGARSAPQLCVGFPGHTCISINDEVAHGIPGDRVVRRGDVVNLDVSAELDGFFADTGASFPVQPVAPETHRLCTETWRAWGHASRQLKPGYRMNRTGLAVERVARKAGLHAIRDLCAHGVGRWLHEDPLEIANVYDPSDRRSFTEGLVVAFEVFLSTGTTRITAEPDGWTLKTADGSRAAQYEHTVIVTRGGPMVVTAV